MVERCDAIEGVERVALRFEGDIVDLGDDGLGEEACGVSSTAETD